MTPQQAIETTHWDRVVAKAGTQQPVMAYPTDRRVMVRHGEWRRGFDPSRPGWLSEVIDWLREGQHG